jgi:LacI family transcriptional regulator
MLAHSLRSNRTQTIALVLTDITNPFWTAVARAVEDEANLHGYIVIFCNTDEDEAKQQQYISMLLRRRVDGVLLVPASGSSHSVLALQGQGVKVVVMDRTLPGIQVDVVRSDSLGGAEMLAAHLLDYGHRRIAILGGPAELSVSQERAAGFRRTLAAAGVELDEEIVFFGHFTFESGRAMAQRALTTQPPPTALFAANNFIALGALRALYDAGLRVPEDMSIVAFDDLPFTELRQPLLTAAAQETHMLGKIAVQRLLARVAENGTELTSEIVLPTKLILRSSVAQIAQ